MGKPIIGIVAKHRYLDERRFNTTIRDEVKDAVFSNGGIAIGLLSPQNNFELIEQNKIYNAEQILDDDEKENLIAQIKLCNGIILQGGILSDAYEVFIAKYCYDNDIPCLAICAGQNNMVRALGGTIKKVENADLHLQPDKEIVHSIKIDKTSYFYNIVQTEKLDVNSRHKHAVDDYKNLMISAVDEYGNIEVTEATDKKFFIGMRFHPESLCKKYKEHNAIFVEFINVCKNFWFYNKHWGIDVVSSSYTSILHRIFFYSLYIILCVIHTIKSIYANIL